ncbi:MAG: tetratricopeptide repeat protein [Planctomycetota bacterium]
MIQFNIAKRVRIAILIVTFGWMGNCESVFSQDTSEAAKSGQEDRVMAIYESTKTAKTTQDFTDMVQLCQSTLDLKDLTPENREYVNSLLGWALNRRAEVNFEKAKSLASDQDSKADATLAEAMADFDRGIIAAPQRYRSWMSRGIAHAWASDYRNAARDFTEVLKQKTDHVPAWFNRAEVLYQMDQFEAAVKDYTSVLRFDSEDLQAITGRGHALFALKRYQDAQNDYDRVIEMASQNDVAYLNRGDVLVKLGLWKEAYADFSRANQLAPNSTGLQRLAWMNATCPGKEVYNPELGLARIHRAVQNRPKTIADIETLAAAQASLGKFEEAVNNQRSAIQLATATEIVDQAQEERLALYVQEKAFRLQETKRPDSKQH